MRRSSGTWSVVSQYCTVVYQVLPKTERHQLKPGASYFFIGHLTQKTSDCSLGVFLSKEKRGKNREEIKDREEENRE